MNRRQLLKASLALPVLAGATIAIQATPTTPKTCKELVEACNAIFEHRASSKAWEDIGSERFVHETRRYTIGEFTEERAIKDLWEIALAQKQAGKTLIFWRYMPKIETVDIHALRVRWSFA